MLPQFPWLFQNDQSSIITCNTAIHTMQIMQTIQTMHTMHSMQKMQKIRIMRCTIAALSLTQFFDNPVSVWVYNGDDVLVPLLQLQAHPSQSPVPWPLACPSNKIRRKYYQTFLVCSSGLRAKKNQERIRSMFLGVFTWQSSRQTESAEQSKISLAVKDLEKQQYFQSNIVQKVQEFMLKSYPKRYRDNSCVLIWHPMVELH